MAEADRQALFPFTSVRDLSAGRPSPAARSSSEKLRNSARLEYVHSTTSLRCHALLAADQPGPAPCWPANVRLGGSRSREAKTSEDHSVDELAATVSIIKHPWRRRLGDFFEKT